MDSHKKSEKFQFIREIARLTTIVIPTQCSPFLLDSVSIWFSLSPSVLTRGINLPRIIT